MCSRPAFRSPPRSCPFASIPKDRVPKWSQNRANTVLGGIHMLLIYLALFDSIAAAQTTTTQASTGSANFSYVSDDGKGPASTAEVTYTRYRYDYVEDIDLGTDLGTSPQPLFSG